MTVIGRRGPPSLSDAAEQLGVPLADLNSTFGVVPIDPDRELYAVEVDAGVVPENKPAGDGDYRGPFANPPIAPFGPPKKGNKPSDN
jgi:hypothetical protein